MSKKTWSIFGAFALIVGTLLACGQSSVSATGTSDNGAGNTTPAAKTNQHFKVGDTVKVSNGLQIVVNKFAVYQVQNEFEQPKSGDQIVLADITITNIGANEASLFGSAEWTLKDSAGQKYESTIADGLQDPSGKLEPNDKLKGQIAWEVPQGVKTFTLAYDPSFLTDGQIIWDAAL